MKHANHLLIIKNKLETIYFRHEDVIHVEDILRVRGYRVVVVNKKYNHTYTELIGQLVNEGEIVIEKSALRQGW